MRYRLDITHRLHRRMLDIVATALPLIASSMMEADLAGLAHLREEMVEAIELYCRHVHRLRERAAFEAEAVEADALAAGCASLQEAYGSFRERWADRPAAEHWHEYRLSAVVMMKKIRGTVQTAEARGAVGPLAA